MATPNIYAGQLAGDAAPGLPRSGRMRRARRVVFVPTRTAQHMAFGSAAAGLLCAPLYATESAWIGVGIALTVFVCWHAVVASRVVPWLPGIMATAACVEWVIAPWLSYRYAASGGVPVMSNPSTEYFAYAVPATLALVAGLYGPLVWSGRRAYAAKRSVARTALLRRTCDGMVIVGVLTRVFVYPLAPPALRFIALLVAHLAFVAVFALLIIRTPGWYWRAVPVFAVEAYYNIIDTQFLTVLQWAIALAVMLLYRYRPRTSVVVSCAVGAIVAVFVLNGIKAGYRAAVTDYDVQLSDRPAIAGRYVYGFVSRPSSIFAPENLARNLRRLNEGWIISRVMAWVPQSEPYAKGETIVTALHASIFPRVIRPNKASAGGFENFPRFTGLPLIKGTSMNLGLAGEMYANFGLAGGIVATFLFGLLVGRVFQVFVRWASQSALWWAWPPYVLFMMLSAEQGTTEVLNHITKSFVFMLAVTTFLPAWAALRRFKFQRQLARLGR